MVNKKSEKGMVRGHAPAKQVEPKPTAVLALKAERLQTGVEKKAPPSSVCISRAFG
jgi:hypothetical protein